MIDTLVVVPTYNSSKSIIELLQEILSQTKSVHILVVDDSSPDRTAMLVHDQFRNEKRVQILLRNKKGGRGSAVLAGFQQGLKNDRYRYFIEMDSDLCHNPKYIPQLIEACATYDIAIASRYMSGSKIIGWHVKRKILSRIMNILLQFVLKIPISDYTNGYRCYRKEALLSFDFKNIQAKGFIVLSEIAYTLYKKGKTFTQVPIIFIHKEQNASNLNFSEMKEALYTIFRLTFK